MNWIDIVIIAILLVNIYFGWTKGFIKSLTNIISIILGFIAAKMYYQNMAMWLNNQFDLYNKIKSGIQGFVSNIKLPELDLSSVQGTEVAVEGESELINNLTNQFINSSSFDNLIQENVSNFGEGFTIWLSENIQNILSMLLVFIIVFIGVRIAGAILSTIFKLPILNGVNKTSGFLFGLAKGSFFAMLFVVVLVIIGPVFSDFNILESLENSSIGIFFYKYNLIMYIFESMT